ncbi:DNA-binding protein, partial [Acinetobacter baumannii]|nr:DNA-binding protein [Acinetobacter baumannii]
MGIMQFSITLEGDTPPQILLGQNLGGAIVTKLEQVKQELVSAAELAKLY